MKRFYAAAFAALVLGMLAARFGRTDDPPAPPQKFGFLDVKKAFENYRKHKDQLQQLKAKTDAFGVQWNQNAKRISDDSAKLDAINPDTEEAAALDEKIAMEKSEIDIAKKAFFRRLDAERRTQEAGIYKEICQEAQAYGAEHGLAAVMLFIPLDADVDRNIDNYLPTRVVLCRDDQLDVTDAVVKVLNNQLPAPKPTVKDLPPAPVKDQPKDPPPANDPPKSDGKDGKPPK